MLKVISHSDVSLLKYNTFNERDCYPVSHNYFPEAKVCMLKNSVR